MPRRSLLSAEQRARLFDVPTTPAEMAKHDVPSPEDLLLERAKRRSMNRLGFAVQLCLLRHPSQGLGPGQQPPRRCWSSWRGSLAYRPRHSPTMRNTIYLDQAVQQLRAQGVSVPDGLLAHVAPLGWEHIALTGDYDWNTAKSVHALRPLRAVPEAFARRAA